MSVACDMHRGKKQDTGSQRVCCLHALLISDRYLHTARIGMAAWVHCQHASRALISKMNKFNTTVSEEKKEEKKHGRSVHLNRRSSHHLNRFSLHQC